MTFLTQFWLPILASAIGVFIASSLVHMVFKWHNSDYRKLANEDAVRDAIRAGNANPGQYIIPHCLEMKELRSPEMMKKFTDGPIGFVMLRPPGPPNMVPALVQWFALSVAVAAIAAYVASQTLPSPPSPGQIWRVIGAMAFLAYGAGSVSQGIWMGRPWVSVAKEILDALIYAAVTACAFVWLWPK